MKDLEVVIATLFEPPTLPVILDSCAKQGIKAHVIKGMPTNHAWCEGMHRAQSRYVMVLNDDLAIDPHDNWAEEVIRCHKAGIAWVAPRVQGEPSVRPDGTPAHLGHAFSLDRSVRERVYPPPQLRLYCGDIFFFLKYGVGYGWFVLDEVQVRIGEDCGLPGRGGWTGHTHTKEAERVLGDTYEAVNKQDHEFWDLMNVRGDLAP